jgi:hypothetical protein
MNATTVHSGRESAATVAIDLANDVFELAFADSSALIVERERLGRGPFQRCLLNLQPLRVGSNSVSRKDGSPPGVCAMAG